MRVCQLDVEQFMRLAGQEIKERVARPAPGVEKLRHDLIMEECNETLSAIQEGDIPAIADGLADMIYVVVGTAIAYGIPLHRIWDVVQEANMRKFQFDEKGYVRRRPDGKVLKPSDWVGPDADIERILRDHGWEG